MRTQMLFVAPVMAGLAAAGTCKARSGSSPNQAVSASSAIPSVTGVPSGVSVPSGVIPTGTSGYGANPIVSSVSSAATKATSSAVGYGSNPVASLASSAGASVSSAAAVSASSAAATTPSAISGAYGANPVVSSALSGATSSVDAIAGKVSSVVSGVYGTGSQILSSVSATATGTTEDIGEVIEDAFENLGADIEEIIGEAAQTLGTIFYGIASKLDKGCTEQDCWNNGYCSFVDYDLPEGINGTASVAGDIWNLGSNCGGCVEVKHEGLTYTLMVTNQASNASNATQLELTPATWDIMTTSDSTHVAAGLKWNWVRCPIQDEPLFVRVHAEATKSWFAVTIENAIERTAKIEISVDAGVTWTACTVDEYNLHVFDGLLDCDSVHLRATSITGKTAIVADVTVTAATVQKGTCNYA